MKSFKKVIALVLAFTLTVGSAMSAIAALVPTATVKTSVYTLQMVGQTMTLLKGGKGFAPYELSKEIGKNGVKLSQNKAGEIKLMFTDANNALRAINIGKETNLEFKGTFPAINIDASVKGVHVTIAAYDKTDKTAIPTIIKDLKVAGAVDLKVSAGAAIDKASITNKDTKLDVAKGSQVKNLSAADGVKIDGTGKKDVTVSGPSTGGSSGGGGGGSSGGGSGSVTPPVVPQTKVAPITNLAYSILYSTIEDGFLFNFPDPLTDIYAVEMYIKSENSLEWEKLRSWSDFSSKEEKIVTLISFPDVISAGNYQVKVVSQATAESNKLANEVIFDKILAISNIPTVAITDITVTNTDKENFYRLIIRDENIKKGYNYAVRSQVTGADLVSISTKCAEQDGVLTLGFRKTYFVPGASLTIRAQAPSSIGTEAVVINISDISPVYTIGLEDIPVGGITTESAITY